jgi:hypothetical protein
MLGYSLYKFEGMFNIIKNKNEISWFIIEDGEVFYECQCSWKEFSQKIKFVKSKKNSFNINTLSWHCHEFRDTSMMDTLRELLDKRMIKIEEI